MPNDEMQRYFVGVAADATFCTSCASYGHLTSECPAKLCKFCRQDHISFVCPQHNYQHAAPPLQNGKSSCAICGSLAHSIDICSRMWCSYYPGTEVRKVKELPAFCYFCGAAGHYGADCKRNRGEHLSGRQYSLQDDIWSSQYSATFLDETSSNLPLNGPYVIPILADDGSDNMEETREEADTGPKKKRAKVPKNAQQKERIRAKQEENQEKRREKEEREKHEKYERKKQRRLEKERQQKEKREKQKQEKRAKKERRAKESLENQEMQEGKTSHQVGEPKAPKPPKKKIKREPTTQTMGTVNGTQPHENAMKLDTSTTHENGTRPQENPGQAAEGTHRAKSRRRKRARGGENALAGPTGTEATA